MNSNTVRKLNCVLLSEKETFSAYRNTLRKLNMQIISFLHLKIIMENIFLLRVQKNCKESWSFGSSYLVFLLHRAQNCNLSKNL
jgi:hypothetical protein